MTKSRRKKTRIKRSNKLTLKPILRNKNKLTKISLKSSRTNLRTPSLLHKLTCRVGICFTSSLNSCNRGRSRRSKSRNRIKTSRRLHELLTILL